MYFPSLFCYHFSLIPEVYEIERDDSGLFGEPGSWERHFSALGNNQRNDSQTVMGLMQKLYMLFSTGDMMLKDKGEAQPEETPAPVSDQQDRKGNVPQAPVSGFSFDAR